MVQTIKVGSVALNGVVDFTTQNVAEIAYVHGKTWYRDFNNLWYFKILPTDNWSTGTFDSPILELAPKPVVIPVTILPGPVVPLVTNTSPTGFTVFWNAPIGTQPISYQVQYRISGSAAWLNVGSATNATSVTITGLKSNSIYDVQVLDFNSVGPGADTPNVLTVLTAFGVTPPGPVSLSVSTIAATSIVISWTLPTGTGPFSYVLSYKFHTDTVWTDLPAVSVLNEGVTGLQPNTVYDFKVEAVNSIGNSISSIVSATTTSLPVGSVGTLVISNLTQTSLTVGWATPSGTAPFTYQLFNRVTGTIQWNLVASVSTLTANVTGLQPQTSYDFEVIPHDAVAASSIPPTIATTVTLGVTAVNLSALFQSSASSTATLLTQIKLAANAVALSKAFLSTGTLTLRNWYENPGQDGTFWVQPFKTTANWITSGSLLTVLRNGSNSSPTGVVNVKGNFAAPWVIGTAFDPLVQVKLSDSSKSINVRIPLGTIIETPDSQFDNSIGGADTTQPYLVWSISGASMNTGSVQASGSVITGTYGLDIDDGSGPIMCDQVTGQPGTNNSIGGIQDFELTQIRTNPNYVIPHMLAHHLDKTTQVSGTGPIWPLKIIDTAGANTGPLPQGLTIGIPSTTVRPTGKTRGFYAWFDQLQQFGSFFYNVADSGAVTHVIYSNNSANNLIVADMQNTISDVMQYVCILNYDTNVAGSQFSVATTKGMATGGVNAYNAPPLLDYSPTGGPVLPSTFGAWYPSGYNVISSRPVGAIINLATHATSSSTTTAFLSTPLKIANASPWNPAQIAQLYNYPERYDGSGQCVAILAATLGGEMYSHADVQTARNLANITQTLDIVDVSCDGGTSNNPYGTQTINTSNSEVGLDTQCVALSAPGAKIRVYWCDGTGDGATTQAAAIISIINAMANALEFIVADTTNAPSILTASFGFTERYFSTATVNAINSVCQDVSNAGITYGCSTGDTGAIDFQQDTDGGTHCQLFAISPYVVAVGGTDITVSNNAISSEVAWNYGTTAGVNADATGGGVSRVTPKPAFQNSVNVPVEQTTGFVGLGEPDLSLVAAIHYGIYTTFQADGSSLNGYTAIGGTSASAPMFAGLMARINQQRTAPMGYIKPLLYGLPSSAWNDVTSGNNKQFGSSVGYDCAVGWDPVTGFGTPKGSFFANALIASIPSSQGTTIPQANVIYDSNLAAYTVTLGKQVAINGTVDSSTSGVVLLLYWNGNVYQENTAGNWYFRPNATTPFAGPVADPRI